MCEEENHGFEGFLHSDSHHSLSQGNKKGERCKGVAYYDIIYDEQDRGTHNKRKLDESRRSHSISCEFVELTSEQDDEANLNLGGKHFKEKNSEAVGVSRMLSKNRLTSDIRDRSIDSLSSIFSTKSNCSRLTEQTHAFSFSSLRRPAKSSRASDSVAIFAPKAFDNDKEKTPRLGSSATAHTQLVNCKGRDEILLDSDNLSSSKKFQCTRRRDESFV